MKLIELDETHLESGIEQNVQTIWHIDPHISDELANIGRKRYLEKVISNGNSFALMEGTEILGFAIGTIPEWDSKFFGFDSYLIKDLYYSNTKVLVELVDNLEKKIYNCKARYSYAKIPSRDVKAIRTLESRGFSLSDIRIIFNRKLKDESPFPCAYGGLNYDIATKSDIEEIAQISKDVIRAGRFHSDSNFPRAKADELYYEWVINGARSGKDIVKCTANNRIVGFQISYVETSLEFNNPSPLSISDLIGVLTEFRGQGIGTGLLMNYFGLAEKKGCQSVITGVHIDNIPTMRLHEGAGFKAIHTEVGLKKWY